MAKTKWTDLVDFESGIKKTEQQVKDLEQEFVKLFKNIRSFAQPVNQEIAKNVTVFKNIGAELKKLNASTPEHRDRIAEISKEVLNLDKSQEQLKETQTAQIKTVNGLNKSYKSLKEELKAEKKALEESNLATKKGREEAQKAAKNIQNLSKRTTDLQRATRGANSSLTAAKGSYNALVLETEKLRTKLKNLDGGFNKNNKEAKKLQATIKKNTQNLKQFDAQMGQSFRNVGNYTSAMRGLNRVAGAFGFAGILFLLANGVKNATQTIIDFDKEMVKLGAILGKNRKDLANIEAEIRRVAKSSLNNAQAVAELATALVTLGKSEKDVEKLLEPVNALSIALEAPAEAAGELLVQTLNAFEQSSDSAQNYADIIAKVRTSTALDFERIKDALGFLAPTANAAGISFEETSAVLGVLVNNGIKAARAGRLMSSSFLRLAENGMSLDDALAELNKTQAETDDELVILAKASKLFGVQSAALGIILSKNIEKTKEYTKEFQNVDGALKDLVDRQLESVSAKLTRLGSAWDEFILSIENGEGSIAEAVKTLVDSLTRAIEILAVINEKGVDASFGFIRISDEARKMAKGIKDEDIPEEIEKIEASIKKVNGQIQRARIEAEKSGTGVEKALRLQDRIVKLTDDNLRSEEVIRLLQKAYVETTDDGADGVSEINKKVEKQLGLIPTLEKKIKALGDAQKEAFTAREVENLQIEIEKLQKQLDGLFKAPGSADEIASKINALREAVRQSLGEKGIEGVDIGEIFKTQFDNIINSDIIGFKKRIDLLEAFNTRVLQSTKLTEDEKKRLIGESSEEIRAIEADKARFILDTAFMVAETIGQLQQIAFNSQSQRMQAESEQIEIQREKEVELAGDNKDRINEINKNFDDQQKVLQTKMAEREKKSAINIAVLQSIISIAKAAASVPFPFNLPAIAVATTIGIAQVSAAQNTPIPQFEEGTKGKKHKGMAIVNERFKEKGSEVFKTDGQYYTMDTKGAAMVNFDRPTEVIGYKDLEYMDKGNPLNMISKKTSLAINNPGFNDSRMVGKLDQMDKSIKDISLNINVRGKGTNTYKASKMRSLNILHS